MSDSEGCQKGAEGVNQVGDESPGESERLTAQWSVEDEEEAARERRRREREKQLRSQAEEGLNSTVSCSESTGPAQENHYDFKPSGTSELEEDEGFSDWSQKLEQRKQRSPRQSYEEEDSGVREAEVKLEQIQLDQESPEEIREENVVIGEEESNSIKKTQPPLPVSKIDDRLEQYTQAIETSTKAPKPVRQPSLDLPTTSMMVASTKICCENVIFSGYRGWRHCE
uniref:Lymphocyte specific protein 1 n=1 Tax=Strix occidentalis caurina TaxID=311401 RepID=A0A8D0KRD8_STROC